MSDSKHSKQDDAEEDKAQLVASVDGANHGVDKADAFTGANVFSFLTAHAGNDKFDEFDDDLDEALNQGSSSDEDESENELEEPQTTQTASQPGILVSDRARSDDEGESLTLPHDDGNETLPRHSLESSVTSNHRHSRTSSTSSRPGSPFMIRTPSNLMESVHHMLKKKSSKPSHSLGQLSKTETRASALNEKLRQQLGIDEDDKLVADYPCWLLKEILLQGHLYLTSRHISFFAYLPRIQSSTLKSGSLQKKSRRPTGGFSRYWFVLRQEAFSYYNSASDLYFPSGVIDLRYAVKATLNEKDNTQFSIITEQRTYSFKSDSPGSAKDWVKTLQKEIFRSRNEGDSVKIVIPVANIIDIEESPIMNVASTLKIRAIDSEETYSIDEYVLAFFHRSEEVVEAIKANMRDMGVDTIAMGSGTLTVAQNRDRIEQLPSASDKHLFSTVTSAATRTISVPGTKLKDLATSTIKRTASPHRSLRELKSKVKGMFESSSDNEESSDEETQGHEQTAEVNEDLDTNILQQQRKALDKATKTEKETEKEISEDEKKAFKAAKHEKHKQDWLLKKLDKSHTDSDGARSPAPSESDSAMEKEASQPNLRSTLPSDYDLMSSNESTGPKATQSAKSRVTLKQYPLHVVSKVTEMWGGGRKHFSFEDDDRGARDPKHLVSDAVGLESNERFRQHFSLTEADSLVATYYCYLQKSLPIYGKLYLSTDHLCFRSLLIGTSTKMILPLIDVENVTKEKGFRFGYSGLVVVVHGHEEIFFEFRSSENRDDCEVMVLREQDHAKSRATSLEALGQERMIAARLVNYEDALEKELNQEIIPIIVDPCVAEEKKLLPNITQKLHITFLTIGSRGDVQPYLAIARGLLKEGHTVRIATHAEFKGVVEQHGCQFREVAGDPGLLMQIMIEHGMFSVSFLRDAASRFRDWINDLLATSWEACQGTDLLIESPSAMAGLHIAEALNIPYMRAFTMPWTRTRAYPHAFIVPEQKMGGSYNYLTYVLFDNVFWKGISGQVNKWRKNTLGLPRTSLDHMQQTRVPFLYNVSPSVLVPPVDYADWVHVTGYWFLDEKDGYEPDEKVVEFIKRARDDNCKIVYIGFGSIVVSNPKEITEAVIESVQKAQVRCILVKGWSDRLSKDKEEVKKTEVPLPDDIYQVDSIPHDWLFPQIDAAVHHGGSGTTGASLRAGLPTIIKPFFGDQFFYANRVEDLGVGVNMRKLNVVQFSKALREVCYNERIISKAADLGKRIRNEHGVQAAINVIYREMDYAKSLAKEKADQIRREKESNGSMIPNTLHTLVRGRSNSSTADKQSCRGASSLVTRPLSLVRGRSSSSANRKNANSDPNTPADDRSLSLLDTSDQLEEKLNPSDEVEEHEKSLLRRLGSRNHSVERSSSSTKKSLASKISYTDDDKSDQSRDSPVPKDNNRFPRLRSASSTASDESWDLVE